MKRTILILVIAAFSCIAWAQETLLYEVCNSATANWTFTNASGSMALQQSTYWLLDNSADQIVSEAYNVNNFSSLTLTFKVGTLTASGGVPHPCKVEYSTNNGATWNASTFTSATPTGVVMISAGIWNLGTLSTSQLRFRWTFAYSVAQAVRIDEIHLQGNPVSPLLMEENFNYTGGTTLVSDFWVGHNTGNSPTVTTTALSYPNYPCISGYSGQTLAETGQDVCRVFAAQTSGSVYGSFLINVTSASTTADYVFHLAPNPTGTTDFKGRVFVQKDASNALRFGVTKSSDASSAVWTGYSYNTGTTYLIVLKYKINPGVTNDNVYLWVDPVITGSEPAPQLTASDVTGADISAVGSVQIRQGTTTPVAYFDGIRIATDWFYKDVTLPVELTSFFAAVNTYNKILIQWVTQTETSVSGYRLYRGTSEYIDAATDLNTFIPATNTSQMQVYQYIDNAITDPGTYYYWLENMDLNGESMLHGPVMTILTSAEPTSPTIPVIPGVNSCYPNPFNPSVTIQYGVQAKGEVDLVIYNLKGQIVRNILKETKNSGTYEAIWNGRDNYGRQVSSGVYLVIMNMGHNSWKTKLVLSK